MVHAYLLSVFFLTVFAETNNSIPCVFNSAFISWAYSLGCPTPGTAVKCVNHTTCANITSSCAYGGTSLLQCLLLDDGSSVCGVVSKSSGGGRLPAGYCDTTTTNDICGLKIEGFLPGLPMCVAKKDCVGNIRCYPDGHLPKVNEYLDASL
eukprot:TRINITY_DN4861_c0_g1_i2.p1 TRINITY_DN4861_c0_g1~~TRINITY_DN4861_c0_g1_i2.p1  ORF type:complete len:151 (-),score=10.73 TRINITY_DN4861_c0_g1_i2:140-592(-)